MLIQVIITVAVIRMLYKEIKTDNRKKPIFFDVYNKDTVKKNKYKNVKLPHFLNK